MTSSCAFFGSTEGLKRFIGEYLGCFLGAGCFSGAGTRDLSVNLECFLEFRSIKSL